MPDPDEPTIAMNSPSCIERFMSLIAWTALFPEPYVLLKLRVVSRSITPPLSCGYANHDDEDRSLHGHVGNMTDLSYRLKDGQFSVYCLRSNNGFEKGYVKTGPSY